jgi:glycine/D-amino acid oxidase-like deaminating enzyme
VDRSAAAGVAGQGGAGLRDAEITIVGGGAVGCAVAYVLARAGYPDIQVVERGELAGATSGQAAGLVGQVRATRERCRLAMASVATYSRIEQETGHTADWRQTGSVRIAMTSDRAAEFQALGAVARSAGLEVEFLTAARLAELCPVLDTTRATAALWCPTDGYLQPNSLVMAYAAAARKRGVTFATHTTVTGVGVSEGAVTGVRTDRGAAATSLLINAAGPWAPPWPRSPGWRSRSCRCATSTSSPDRSRAGTVGCRYCASPTSGSTPGPKGPGSCAAGGRPMG